MGREVMAPSPYLMTSRAAYGMENKGNQIYDSIHLCIFPICKKTTMTSICFEIIVFAMKITRLIIFIFVERRCLNSTLSIIHDCTDENICEKSTPLSVICHF